MKYALLAAVALIASPALAQTSGSAGTMSPTTTGAQPRPETNNPAPPMQDRMAPAPMAEPAPPPPAPMADGTMQSGSMTAGGYQPAMAPMAPPPPGATVRYVPPQTIEQAYPAPAPMATYPICKRGQTDHCKQRGG